MIALEANGLTKHFRSAGNFWSRGGKLHAVDDVDLTLRPGSITALVGESGSGKSTVARMIARLYEPTAGTVRFDGTNATALSSRRELRRYRSQVQMIFQDPFGSLNPAKTVEYHVARPLRIHRIAPSGQIRLRVYELLETVGLVPPKHIAEKYPHELSGGQRQRVAIARALAVDPAVILADEPTSMLDVSIRIGILNLMLRLKEERNLALLYVTHDLAAARYVADEMLVMYAGQIVEQGPTEDVLQDPQHPYTRLLLSAVPDPSKGLHVGTVAMHRSRQGAIDPEAGCRFRDRCPLAIAVCSETTPELVSIGGRRSARCHVTAPAGLT